MNDQPNLTPSDIPPEIPKNPPEERPLFKTRLTLMKKSLRHQYIILLLWITSILIVIWYLSYLDSIQALVKNGILPIMTWLQDLILWIGIGIGIIGCLLLIYAPNKTY
jgi:hypothetical protein